MKSKEMQALRAKMPREVQAQVTLERHRFSNEGQAERAARAFYSQHPESTEPLWLVSHLASRLFKRTVFFLKAGKLIRGLAVVQEVAS